MWVLQKPRLKTHCQRLKKPEPIVDAQVEKASFEHYTLQEVGKSAVLLDAAILLLDEAAEYLDELDQLSVVSAEQSKVSLSS